MNAIIGLVLGLFAVSVVVAAILILRVKGRGDSDSKHIWMGLRVVDVFVPIARGTDILVSGEERSGARVLGTELMHRLMHHPQEKFHIVYYIDATLKDLDDWKKELSQTLPELTSYHVVDRINMEHLVGQVRNASHRQVAVFALSFQQGFLDTYRVAIEQARTELQSKKSITSFAVTELNKLPAQVNLVVSRALATAAVYPAIDVDQSQSVINDVDQGARRLKVANMIKVQIAEVMKDIYQDSVNDPQWQYNSDTTLKPALQALLFNSQPLFVATPFTGMQAAFVKESDAIRDYERIVSGSLNALPNASFRFKNALPA